MIRGVFIAINQYFLTIKIKKKIKIQNINQTHKTILRRNYYALPFNNILLKCS